MQNRASDNLQRLYSIPVPQQSREPAGILFMQFEAGRLAAGSSTPPSNATYAFDYSRSPFSFTVTRAGNTADQSLFTTKGSRLIFKVISTSA
jgi:hypothetical protein